MMMAIAERSDGNSDGDNDGDDNDNGDSGAE